MEIGRELSQSEPRCRKQGPLPMNGEISILSPLFKKPSLRLPHKPNFQSTTAKRLLIEIYADWQNLSLRKLGLGGAACRT